MQIGGLIIGDELLSGKRRDKHMDFLISVLARRGLELSFVRFVGDDPGLLTESLRQTLDSQALIFSFGGIGATPDDRTRQCFARAANVELGLHPEAVAILEERFGEQAYPHRIRMAELPVGSALIPNPVNQIPGFSMRHHHCVPGFPNMAWPMVEWVLDTHYNHLFSRIPCIERLILVSNTPESELVPVMEAVLERFPEIRMSSLPSSENGCREVELGIKGLADQVAEAAALVIESLNQGGMPWVEKPQLSQIPS
ncbi:molybdopterin binding domain-containing protein [Ectothiorhodospira sp. PHS-1]|uniref:competence/damage-inducible protein A n=1 Tax=Ectothiorhodospira sp. PHS-1 TaxID=519989 RepID=UPI00024A8A09|nr:molybdopterin-binding protein [Ectothiorhodospira sp. PHS-1]EHQ53680.1 molybdopterin binding domain-containing protein [Ectothiorhodospira sp. PHS-1]